MDPRSRLRIGEKVASLGPDGTRLEFLPELGPDERHARFGSIGFEPSGSEPIVAGEHVTVTWWYRAGDCGLPPGARFGICWRLPCDWGTPQFGDANGGDFVRVDAPEGVRATPEFSHRGGVPPWHHLLSLHLGAGGLAPGEVVRVTCGASRDHDLGWSAPTAALPDHQFLGVVRTEPDGTWVSLARPTPLRVVGGPPTALEVSCPTDVVVGERFEVLVRALDVWGNPARGGVAGAPKLLAGGRLVDVRSVEWDGENHDLWRLGVRVTDAGTTRFRVGTGSFEAESNPVRVHAESPRTRVFWGDLHGGQGALGVGQGDLDRYFAFAREVADLQFSSHQANDVYVTQSDWHHTRDVTERHHRPGAFVAFLGCEWTALPELGGDRNVVYRFDRPRLQRAGRWFSDPDDWPDAPTPPDLYRSLTDVDALINLHVGGFTSDLSFHDPRLERLIEVHSTHATSRWFVAEALERGSKLGVSGGSDAISGRTGGCRPGRRQSRNLRSGVTAVRASGLSRAELWEALAARRCYATSGARIVLDVEAAGHGMGSEFRTATAPPIHVEVIGTAAIERLVLRRGGTTIAERRLAGADAERPDRFLLAWRGSRTRGASRHQRLDWDGSFRVEGRIVVAGTLGFEPVDGVEQVDHGAVAWRSVTAGNEAGLLLDIDAPADATCEFRSLPCGWIMPWGDACQGVASALPELLDAGVRLERARDPRAPREATVTFEAALLDPGPHAYWVEVVQVDGARAWSSPLFIDLHREGEESPLAASPRPTEGS